MSYSIDTKLGELLETPATKEILEKHLPGIADHPKIGMGKGFSLKMVAGFSGGLITAEALEKINAELKAL